MISHLQMITIYVGDLERALNFYAEKLGFVKTAEFDDGEQCLAWVVPAAAAAPAHLYSSVPQSATTAKSFLQPPRSWYDSQASSPAVREIDFTCPDCYGDLVGIYRSLSSRLSRE